MHSFHLLISVMSINMRIIHEFMLMLQNLAHVAGGEGNIVVVLLLLNFLLLLVFIHHYFLYCRISLPPQKRERERDGRAHPLQIIIVVLLPGGGGVLNIDE